MNLFRPLQSNYKTQSFGENKPCVVTDIYGNPLRPVRLLNSSDEGICPVGSRPFYQTFGLKGHNGEDWAAWNGEPFYFPWDMDMTWKAKNEKDLDGGLGLDVTSTKEFELFGKKAYWKLRFWHLKESAIADGEPVIFGQYLGRCDSTGASTAPHLHWSLKPCKSDGSALEPLNGYTGVVDFAPIFQNTFVLDVVSWKKQALSWIDQLKRIVFELQMYLQQK